MNSGPGPTSRESEPSAGGSGAPSRPPEPDEWPPAPGELADRAYSPRPTAGRPCFVIAAGGSGGHLTPGLAVAEALHECWPQAHIHVVTSGRGVEQQFLAGVDLTHTPLEVRPPGEWRSAPWRMATSHWKAFRQADALLRQLEPDMVIGCGGFTMAPVMLAARRSRFPTVLLEQNVLPGRATSWFAGNARLVCLSFADSHGRLPRAARCVVTGNPVRRAIVNVRRATSVGSTPMACSPAPASALSSRASPGSAPPMLLVLGGSQGARGINLAIQQVVCRHADLLRGWRLVVQAGGADAANELQAACAAAAVDAEVHAFLGEPHRWYAEAELVISRAGATTLAELACVGLPAVLIPFPQAADDHQRLNAEVFEAAGAAAIVRQSEDPAQTAAALQGIFRDWLGDAGRRAAAARAMHRLARPMAAREVAARIAELLTPGQQDAPSPAGPRKTD